MEQLKAAERVRRRPWKADELGMENDLPQRNARIAKKEVQGNGLVRQEGESPVTHRSFFRALCVLSRQNPDGKMNRASRWQFMGMGEYASPSLRLRPALFVATGGGWMNAGCGFWIFDLRGGSSSSHSEIRNPQS
jgi:hypothetical protein